VDVRYAAEDALVVRQAQHRTVASRVCEGVSTGRPHILEALAKLGDRKVLDLARVQYKKRHPLERVAVEKQLAEQLAAATKKR